jgi:hypothetical protein
MELLGLILLILVGGVTLISMFAAIHLLLPGPVEKASLNLENHFRKAFLVGLVNLLFLVLLMLGVIWAANAIGGFVAGPLTLVVALIAILLVVFTLNGLVALASLLGSRIGPTRSPLLSDLRGGLLLILACLTPYIGWFVFTPFVLCLGLGASVLALFQKERAVPVEEKTTT